MFYVSIIEACSEEKQPIKSPLSELKNSLSEVLETKTVSSQTKANITRLYDEFGDEKIFGRGDVIENIDLLFNP